MRAVSAIRAGRATAGVLVWAAVLGGCTFGSPAGSGTPGATASPTGTAAAPGTARPPASAPGAPPASPATTAPATTGAATPTAPPTAPPAPTPTPTPPPTRADEDLLIVTRSGGLAGRQSSLVIQGDGSWTRLNAAARTVGSGKLTAGRLARLRAALAEAEFPRLPRISMGDRPVFDGFVYAFVHGGYEVATADGSIPPALTDVLAELPEF
ncbi:hypothetical protein [Streptomyces sp. NPDC051211]|uniref:hypothetical protein n=1 Tax=Streptomyces sp. NPDC051211 TaxID=3154643 RepID=UPI00344EA424